MTTHPTSGTRRPSRRLGRALLATAGATTVALGAVALPAAAAPAPPYATSTTVTAAPGKVVTGQAVTYTAKVKALKSGGSAAVGQVVFTITGSDLSPVACAAGNTVTVAGGQAQCSVPGGLLAAASTYSVTAEFSDNVDTNDQPSTGSLTTTVTQGSTTTTVTSTSSPSVTGQPVTLTAAVATSGRASGSPSGTVTFAGVTCDGGDTVPVASGLAQCPLLGGLSSGASPYQVSAAYSGDANFAGSSGKFKQLVGKAGATLTLASVPDTCTGDVCSLGAGVAVSFTASVAVAAPGGGAPAGPVVFSIVPAGQKSSLPCDGGNSVGLSGGQATCSIAAGLPAVVYYTVTATLADPNYQAATASLYENTAMASTSTTVSMAKGVTAGQTFTVTAHVTALGGGSAVPTGYVNITLCGPNSNGWNGCQGGNAAVGADGSASLLIGGGEYPGIYTDYATYLGDQNFYSSSAKKSSQFIPMSPTSITILSSANPSIDGSPVTFTAILTAANGSAGSTLVGPPTGNIVFSITGPSGSYTCAGDYGNSIPLDNGVADEGVATCYLPAGDLTDPAAHGTTKYTVKASYSTDYDYGSSTGNLTQLVVPAIV